VRRRRRQAASPGRRGRRRARRRAQGAFRRTQLKAMLDIHGVEEGLGGDLTPDEIGIIRGALDLSHKTAATCMTPFDKAGAPVLTQQRTLSPRAFAAASRPRAMRCQAALPSVWCEARYALPVPHPAPPMQHARAAPVTAARSSRARGPAGRAVRRGRC